MAGEFLRSHGVDIDAEMARIQNGASSIINALTSVSDISNVSLPGTDADSAWTLSTEGGHVKSVSRADGSTTMLPSTINGGGALLAPSLCHPHIHIDKAYILSHPKYAHLQIEKGDFAEAMSLTGKAKSQFERKDLLERGQRVVDESVAAGVTHMRAFVEVDAGVGNKCLDAGLELKAANAQSCEIQLCAFAQLPLFSSSDGDEHGDVIRDLMEQAASNGNVDVVGSTPYVESDRQKMQRNVEWMVDLSIKSNTHLDFHLDYNLDPDTEPLVWHVIQTLIDKDWKGKTQGRTIVLGHCTRLTLFDDAEWRELAKRITEAQLPISFVGLPTSDLYMMRTGKYPEIRGTLDVPRLINQYGLNACIGANNIGNAFTPQGSCDPLSLACQGVGIYQAGTQQDAELLYECISTRAKAAIGFGREKSNDVALGIRSGDATNLVLFRASKPDWRTRKKVNEAVYLYDHCQGRKTFFRGRQVTPSNR